MSVRDCFSRGLSLKYAAREQPNDFFLLQGESVICFLSLN
ncbi:mCG1044645 [Mus musculus]|nr:mCG1044645 [Mus musculus]